MTVDRRHNAQPGPMYWDWRCLVCSEPVSDRTVHRPWWKRWGR